MNIVQATREFEAWLAGSVSVVQDQLTDKHSEMAKNSIRFLRGTFYRWAQLFPAICRDVANSVNVLAVGDLHSQFWHMARRVWPADLGRR
jgi:hypothetical protein